MDKRSLIALIVCGLIMILYFPFILPMLSKRTENTQEGFLLEETDEIKTEEKQRSLSLLPSQSAVSQADISLEEVVIENELVRTVWTNEGAALKSIQLKEFKAVDTKNTLDLVKSVDTGYLPLAIDTIFQETNFRNHRYSIADRSGGKITFSTSLGDGVNLVKTVSLPYDKYHVSMDVIIENNTDAEVDLAYTIIASSMITHEGEPSTDMAAVTGVDMENNRIKLVKTAPKSFPSQNESRGIVWTGSMNKYFATVLKPESSNWIESVNAQAFDAHGALSNEKATQGDFLVRLQTNNLRVPPHNIIKHTYLYFIGPKKEDVLVQYDTLSSLLSYGWLNSISKALLGFLNAVHRVIPNYGISIIILTIIIKACLFPLTRKSQVSMFKMQQLQPLINQLKEKYKDKQRVGKEQMLLFKKHGVNPMSGCLPMLLQLPVFFALFRTLQLSFEMRQAPFVLWINDLSRPDTLLLLPFTIPFLGNTLNILPLIMTGASFAQMKITPKSPAADPQAQAQQKMMSFMPIMFAFILYKMPSGLTLYWTTSTIFSIIESIFIRKSTKKLKINHP